MLWVVLILLMAFVPGIDYGFNDVSSVLTLNGDFHYQLSHETAWQPYVGLGAEVNVWRDTGERDRDRSTTQTGGHLIVGAATRNPRSR